MAIPIIMQPPYLQTVLTALDTAETQSTVIDIGSLPIRLSIQTNVDNVTSSAQGFIDGVRATSTFTITNYVTMNHAKATGTYTVVDYTALAGKTITVNGIVLTEGVHWTAAVDNDTTATSIASAITTATGTTLTTAAAVSAVVTVTANSFGTAGNSITTTTNGSPNLTVQQATLSGGLNYATVTVGSTTLTTATDFNAVTSNNQTATNLAAAIDALSGVNSTATNAVVTVNNDVVGTVGNSVATSVVGSGVTAAHTTLLGGINSDINDSTEVITITAHGFITAEKVHFDVDTGSAPTGLTDNTNYYVIKLTANTFQLAATKDDAEAGTYIDLTGNPVGGGDFDLTPSTAAYNYAVDESNDNVNWGSVNIIDTSGTGSTVFFDELPTPCSRYLRITVTPTGGEVDINSFVHTKF